MTIHVNTARSPQAGDSWALLPAGPAQGRSHPTPDSRSLSELLKEPDHRLSVCHTPPGTLVYQAPGRAAVSREEHWVTL